MNIDPTVSVICPVLNGVETIEQTLDSVLHSSKKRVELVVIDGGSTDGTLDILHLYKKHINVLEIGLDSGISDAFNRGIRHCSGDFIAILNSDDYWEESTLQYLCEAISNNPQVDVFCGAVRFIDSDYRFTYVKHPKLHQMRYRMSIFHPGMFVRRRVYKEVGNYNVKYLYAMDSEWCHRAMNMRMQFQEIPHVMANMRLGGRSDKNFVKSLLEYRSSTIKNDISNVVFATLSFAFVVVLKTLLRFKYLRLMKYKLLDHRS